MMQNIGKAWGHSLGVQVIGVSLALGMAPALALGTQGVESGARTTQQNGRSNQIAQQVRNFCGKSESMFLSMETKNYWVNICGGDNPSHYVGVNKKSRQSIRVRLKDYDPKGTYFEAVNGDVMYILAQTPRGKFLTVTKGTTELLREPITRGW
ncbi:MAG: hypothetical protein SFW36_23260 [Leptolyngbyaceae cyanobacterium bins.59]|nr:hypothetical protein [Leptolyngbyaceae cyanobacterium bins.59]